MYQQPFLYKPCAAEIATLDATPVCERLDGQLAASAWNDKTTRVMIQNCGATDLGFLYTTADAAAYLVTALLQLPPQQILVLNMESPDLHNLWVFGGEALHPVGVWQEGLK